MRNENSELNSLENRQFIDKIISYNNFDIDNNLLKVNGIYYHFIIENSSVINPSKKYQIIIANGNILKLKEI